MVIPARVRSRGSHSKCSHSKCSHSKCSRTPGARPRAPAGTASIAIVKCSRASPRLAAPRRTSPLQAARRREASLGVDVQQGDWTREEDEARARWAYSEAKRLLQVSGAQRVTQRAACYLVLATCYLLPCCLPLTYFRLHTAAIYCCSATRGCERSCRSRW